MSIASTGSPAERHPSRSFSDSDYAFNNDLTGLLEEIDSHPSACGGFSDVYKYRNRSQTGPEFVAVKSLRIYNGFDVIIQEASRRMKREVRAWTRLKHPNILELLGTFNRPGLPLPCLVSPWMKNKTATGYLQKEPTAKLIPFIFGIANGLSHLHSNNIAHGDIRGDNILVNDNGEACIGDFGLSKLVDGLGVTTSTSDSGPSRWMAIEYLIYGDNKEQPPHSPTKPGDVWSFGMTCLELWSGCLPYYDIKRERVPLAISEGQLPKFPEPKRVDFVREKERIRTICILSWVKDSKHRPGIDILCPVIQAYKEADEDCSSSPDGSARNGTYRVDEEISGFVTSPIDLQASQSPQGDQTPRPQAESMSPVTPDDSSANLFDSATDSTNHSEENSSNSSTESQPGTDENASTQDFIPLFSKPLPLLPTSEAMINDTSISHKGSLQTYFSRKGEPNAMYFISAPHSADNPYDMSHSVICMIRDTEYGRGTAWKAKDAEDKAARQALLRLYSEDRDGVASILQYYPRLEIHLANCKLSNRVRWVYNSNGPPHKPAWSCGFKVDNILFAHGSGSDKKQAREDAARNTALLWIEAMQ